MVIFYTPAHCWQFQVIGPDGVISIKGKIYYTPEAAELAGRNWILSAS